MPPIEEMGPPDLDVIRQRQQQYDGLNPEVQALVTEYGFNKTMNALNSVGGYVAQARCVLEERVGPPLVPRKGRV